MLWAASLLLRTIYLLMPLAALVLAWRGTLRRFVLSGWVGGTALGGVVVMAYAVATGGTPPVSQIALTVYLGIGLMLTLKSIDLGLQWLLRRGLLSDKPRPWRVGAVAVLRLLLLGTIALPWVMAAAMVYRPRVASDDTPRSTLQIRYDDVTFTSGDGTRIAAWFVPAREKSRICALLCHGLGSSKAGFFQMMDRLHRAGIGVLAIDLRAHGRSGGQICSFGLREAGDVAASVAWLKAEHADAAERIIGVGASLGAAALLSDAADDLRIDGVVVLSTYATMEDQVNDVSHRQLVPPISGLVRAFGLALASLHAGVDLRAERPIDAIAKLWPRPVLIVHGTEDEIIPFHDGPRLYDAAPIGRQSLWVPGGTHNGILENADVIDRVIAFIKTARPTPEV